MEWLWITKQWLVFYSGQFHNTKDAKGVFGKLLNPSLNCWRKEFFMEPRCWGCFLKITVITCTSAGNARFHSTPSLLSVIASDRIIGSELQSGAWVSQTRWSFGQQKYLIWADKVEHILGQWLNPNEEAIGKDLSLFKNNFLIATLF